MKTTNVLMTFLGVGSPIRNEQKVVSDHVYKNATYFFDGRESTSRYVQAALLSIERQSGVVFDRIIIAMTGKSRAWHWDMAGRLRDELDPQDRDRVQIVELSENLDVGAQWEGFGRLLDAVPRDCSLSVDMTHGYRVVPILFSVAVELLTRLKDVELRHVFYGAYEEGKERHPIVEVSRFFEVTRWAEAIRQVTEDVNPDKLARLAREPHGALAIAGLTDERFVDAMERLAAVVKNANAAEAASTFEDGLHIIRALRANANPVTKAMLDLLEQKFGSLHRAGGRSALTAPWYETQLTLADVMIEHGLLMQGLTILQELMTSVCEEYCRKALRDDANPVTSTLKERGRGTYRKKVVHVRQMGESLSARLRLPPDTPFEPTFNWDPDDKVGKPLVEHIFAAQFEAAWAAGAFGFMQAISKLRNAFNHAWMGRNASPSPEAISQETAELARQARDFILRELASGGIGGGVADPV